MTELLLISLVVIPLLGALLGALLPDGKPARGWALFVSLLTAVATAALAWQFPWNTGDRISYGFTGQNAFQIQSLDFGLRLGADAVSMWLVILTAFLTPLAIAASFGSIRDR